MRFLDALALEAREPGNRRFAERRTGNRELAEDALQETYWTVAKVKNPEAIRNLRAYFRTALVREIIRQRSPQSFTQQFDDDLSIGEEKEYDLSSNAGHPSSVDNEVSSRLLAETLLRRLNTDHDSLVNSIPGRSNDHGQYRNAIMISAKKIFILLLEGQVVQADWNAVLKAEYPEWANEQGMTRDTIDQRLSRARHDIKILLQKVARRSQLA